MITALSNPFEPRLNCYPRCFNDVYVSSSVSALRWLDFEYLCFVRSCISLCISLLQYGIRHSALLACLQSRLTRLIWKAFTCLLFSREFMDLRMYQLIPLATVPAAARVVNCVKDTGASAWCLYSGFQTDYGNMLH